MEVLKTLIRNLAFILLLATFLEMLLPNKSMKGFVQVVMGLFVIAAVLNPVVSFLNLDVTNEVPAWVESASTDLPVLAAEGKAIETGKSAVREQYRKILINQIQILVSSVEGIQECTVDVELDKNGGGFGDYPQILGVMIDIRKQFTSIRPVDPIVIGAEENTKNNSTESKKAIEVRETVASLMQIPEDIITVKED